MLKINKKSSLFIILVAVFFFSSVSVARAIHTEMQPSQLKTAWRDFQETQWSAGVKENYPFMAYFKAASHKHQVSLPLLIAVAKGESSFNPKAKSIANCHGIMQIKWPGTAGDLGINRKEDLYNPEINIDAGARYLKFLIDHYEGDLYLVLAAYNRGLNRVKRGPVDDKGLEYLNYIYRHLQTVMAVDYVAVETVLVLKDNIYREIVAHAAFFENRIAGIPLEIRKHNYDYLLVIVDPEKKEALKWAETLKRETGITPIELKEDTR